ncbi:MAG: hypothetical protein GY777_04755 [Candidatus Brocadiaceae bacterium]|nr:hypothetical protein [Candidatus Brocadiaceae bacterium]
MTKLKTNQDYQVAPKQVNLTTLKTKAQLNSIIVDRYGRPDYLAINLYWDSFRSWYNPKIPYKKGDNIYYLSKLKTKGIFLNYKKLAEAHGCSREAIRQKAVKLEQLGLIHRSFQHKETVTTKSYNKLVIYVWKDTPYFYNNFGTDYEKVELNPHTNHEYIAEKYKKQFLKILPQEHAGLTGGGIQAQLDTKELNNYSNKLEYRSNQSKFLNSNLRKKTTNAEKKHRYYKFNQYNKPKTLTEHYPLSQEDCWELQKRSGKAYNLNATNEILLDISRKPKTQGHSFISKAKFMAYMTKAYREEGRDVDKANLPGFKIIKRRPQAEITEIITLAQREKYLNETENAGIHTRSDYTQFRARIAGQFPVNLGYDLLSNMIDAKKKDNVFKITMHKSVELTENYKQLVLNHASGIGGYVGINKLEFIER